MAVSTGKFVVKAPDTRQPVAPVSIVSNWVTAHDKPEEADNSGNIVRNPVSGGNVASANHFLLDTDGMGTTLLLRMKYDDGVTGVTNPKVNVYGVDGNGVYHRLKDASGAYDLTISVDTTNDQTDGTDNYTATIEVDMDGCEKVLVTIHTAFAATGTVNTSVIQAKMK